MHSVAERPNGAEDKECDDQNTGSRHSASISVKMMQELADATVIGPILSGVDKPIQICSTGSTVNDILNMALLAASKAR